MKIGRNDLCWCGSGLKYKNCHLGRDKQAPVNLWQAAKELRQVFSLKECLAPPPMKNDCAGTIVKAHTIPKSGSLRSIARDNHVYSYVLTLENMVKYAGKIEPELVGIRRASIFTGFCSHHDNSIFAPIEIRPFITTQEQLFLLGYRAVARELFTKRALISSSAIRRKADQGKSESEQRVVQSFSELIDIGASDGLKSIEYHKELYDKVLLSSNFNSVRAYVLSFNSPPQIMCSAGLFPEYDLNGSQLQDISKLGTIPSMITYTSFYSENQGLIVFTWLADSDSVCQRFINSLRKVPINRVTDALIRFFFTFSENLHIQPDWWESLGTEKREHLTKRLAESVDVFSPRSPSCIAENGIQFDNWPLRHTKLAGH